MDYRGLRIYKVLSYYEDYWVLMKNLGEEAENRVSAFMNREEAIRLEKIKKWRENSLIAFLMLNIILPLFVLSLIAFIIPYVYVIVPVYESDTCWDYFSNQALLNNFSGIPCSMKVANSILFIVINWAEIFGFCLLYWIIRNIKNELNIKAEVQTMLICWMFFSLIYFSTFLRLQSLKTSQD
jgi:hypothetical protein